MLPSTSSGSVLARSVLARSVLARSVLARSVLARSVLARSVLAGFDKLSQRPLAELVEANGREATESRSYYLSAPRRTTLHQPWLRLT